MWWWGEVRNVTHRTRRDDDENGKYQGEDCDVKFAVFFSTIRFFYPNAIFKTESIHIVIQVTTHMYYNAAWKQVHIDFPAYRYSPWLPWSEKYLDNLLCQYHTTVVLIQNQMACLKGGDMIFLFLSFSNLCCVDIEYLRTSMPPETDPEFFTYLMHMDANKVELHAMPEGSIVFPRVPLIRIHGPLPGQSLCSWLVVDLFII